MELCTEFLNVCSKDMRISVEDDQKRKLPIYVTPSTRFEFQLYVGRSSASYKGASVLPSPATTARPIITETQMIEIFIPILKI